jgi:predicted phage baseplate assembly protein
VSTLQVSVEGFSDPWKELPSLLDSRSDEQVFRVEIDDEGEATVVFGDGTFGLRPAETANVTATYRVGGGSAGNVAADVLTLPQPGAPWLISVTNPLPATGGRDLESRQHARRVGPPGFHEPLVAVTAADYQNAAQNFIAATNQKPIQRANASFRWTGSWLTVTLAVEPRSTEVLAPELRNSLLAYLDGRRLTGYDLELTGPIYVPVELELEFCTLPGFFPDDIAQALQTALSNRVLPGGGTGFFHPDNFTFGDNLYISRLFETVMSMPGVEAARIVTLARMHSARAEAETAANLRQGFLAVGPSQIVRLDNDRNFPENGSLLLRPLGVAL